MEIPPRPNAKALVPLLRTAAADQEAFKRLDAVYVPCRGRPEKITRLLRELDWFEQGIYLLGTSADDIPELPRKGKGPTALLAKKAAFKEKYRALKTSRHPLTRRLLDSSDLQLKRNLALLHARANHYRRILMLDDDISGLNRKALARGTELLEDHDIAGCFVDEYPDMSVVGHVMRHQGEPLEPFLSGSFMFIRADRYEEFFPNIYNEDWLFMIAGIERRRVVSFGTIRQDRYDPFGDATRPATQEFGEVVMQGLYELLHAPGSDGRFSTRLWAQTLKTRARMLETLLARADSDVVRRLLKLCQEAFIRIRVEDCIQFVKDWDEDLAAWKDCLADVRGGPLDMYGILPYNMYG